LSLSLGTYASGALLDEHSHEGGGVSIVLAGSVEEHVGVRLAQGRIGSLVVKPPGTVHRNLFGSAGAILLSIANAPPALFDRLGWRWLDSARHTPAAMRASIALLEGDPFGEAQEAAWQILSAADDAEPTPVRIQCPLWLSSVRDSIADARARPSVSGIANAMGIHPVYLTRAFRKRYGCSISQFIRRLRVQRGADLLARTDLQISAIAAEFGFADQSHFCRAFRAEMGVAPSIYRSVMRAGTSRC
jgi:AraC family transcriptional regulator